MFITHKKGLTLDGNNPTLLYGYGGFYANLLPFFSISRTISLEQGGIFAVSNLRGGGEYGEDWHRAGMLEKKQKIFDDFIAAGEWLIEHNYTRSERLAIQGDSNGGLLVAACCVVPAHAKKFAATLQRLADSPNKPILLRVETKAGHRGGKPTAKVIKEEADIYAFLWEVLGRVICDKE